MSTGFPRDFIFGVATSAYQIEGAHDADGKAPSIWDTFCRRPGAIDDASSGDVACDHYHRYLEDVRHMAALGVDAYRFSISWPRVMDASGGVNARGLDFYDRVVDALLEARIRPFATLYHWDLPQSLQDGGGWASRETVERFAELAYAVGARLGDRVKDWITVNEPEVVAFVGNAYGLHAPGLRDPKVALRVAHNLLLAHRAASRALRALDGAARVGISVNLNPAHPATSSADDIAAARRLDGYFNRWYLDPLHGRGYPADMVKWYGGLLDPGAVAEMRDYDGGLDFLGINYYSRRVVRASNDGLLSLSDVRVDGSTHTNTGWEVYPEGLSEILQRVAKDYGPKAIYVTENGASFDDHRENGSVPDIARTGYLKTHFAAAARAINSGVPLEGYFVWSFMDNFEWHNGYTKRFGVVYVDFPTQQRIDKGSARWFREFLAAR
ncbi:MAG TPA: GH1 family beta-glucosidase [Candidatus Limnocylindrales bacterium]|nr:GH1 family beta-glucosidase [Candidatus Limnocylindrales bacterium]